MATARTVESAPIPVPSSRAASVRSSLAGRLGVTTLLLVVVACLGSLPWTLGRVPVGDGVEHRYEAGDLDLGLLPPPPAALSEEAAATVRRLDDAGSYVPDRLLGTDRFGRSTLVRLLLGGAVSLGIGLVAAGLAVGIGTAIGATAGFVGGRFDAIAMRFVDILYGLPYILLVVLVSVAADGVVARLALDPSSGTRQVVNLATLLVAIGGVGWLTTARVVRGQVLSLREQPFMEACRAQGMGAWRQFTHHLLPNLIGPIVVYGTLAVPAAILSESFLSFLGIGVAEPLPSWGNLASEALGELHAPNSRWWLLSWPCLMIGVTLVSLNLVGDRLKARFDPAHGSP